MVDDDAQPVPDGLYEQHLDLRLGGREAGLDICLKLVHGEKKAGGRPLGMLEPAAFPTASDRG